MDTLNGNHELTTFIIRLMFVAEIIRALIG